MAKIVPETNPPGRMFKGFIAWCLWGHIPFHKTESVDLKLSVFSDGKYATSFGQNVESRRAIQQNANNSKSPLKRFGLMKAPLQFPLIKKNGLIVMLFHRHCIYCLENLWSMNSKTIPISRYHCVVISCCQLHHNPRFVASR